MSAEGAATLGSQACRFSQSGKERLNPLPRDNVWSHVSLCGQGSLLKDGDAEKTAVTRRCRSWGCDNCVESRRKGLFCEACAGNPTIFVTFTTRRVEGASPIEEAKRQSLAFREFMRRWAREKSRKAIQYFAVREEHKSGWPHLHVLVRGPFWKLDRMKAVWLEITGSDRVWPERVDSQKKAAKYLASYLKKAPAKFGTAKRYWKSQGYDLRDDDDDEPDIDFGSPWEQRNESIISFGERWALEGWTVVFEGMFRVKATGPPGTPS
jgi:hypothetical protein